MSHDDSTTPRHTTPTDPQPMSTADSKPAPPVSVAGSRITLAID